MVAVKFTCAQSAQKGQLLTAHPVDGPLISVAPLRWEAEGRVQCRNVGTIAMTTPGGTKKGAPNHPNISDNFATSTA